MPNFSSLAGLEVPEKFVVVGWVGGWGNTWVLCPRAGNSGGTREPSSQKEFGFAESFFDFEVFTELNSKNVSEITAKIICFA